MKIVLLLVLLLMLNALAYSQQKTLPETSTENTIPADSIALIDNLASGLISEDSISSPFFIILVAIKLLPSVMRQLGLLE